MHSAGWEGNFHDPVRCAITAKVIQFIFIADNRNIRFDMVFVIFA